MTTHPNWHPNWLQDHHANKERVRTAASSQLSPPSENVQVVLEQLARGEHREKVDALVGDMLDRTPADLFGAQPDARNVVYRATAETMVSPGSVTAEAALDRMEGVCRPIDVADVDRQSAAAYDSTDRRGAMADLPPAPTDTMDDDDDLFNRWAADAVRLYGLRGGVQRQFPGLAITVERVDSEALGTGALGDAPLAEIRVSSTGPGRYAITPASRTDGLGVFTSPKGLKARWVYADPEDAEDGPSDQEFYVPQAYVAQAVASGWLVSRDTAMAAATDAMNDYGDEGYDTRWTTDGSTITFTPAGAEPRTIEPDANGQYLLPRDEFLDAQGHLDRNIVDKVVDQTGNTHTDHEDFSPWKTRLDMHFDHVTDMPGEGTYLGTFPDVASAVAYTQAFDAPDHDGVTGPERVEAHYISEFTTTVAPARTKNRERAAPGKPPTPERRGPCNTARSDPGRAF